MTTFADQVFQTGGAPVGPGGQPLFFGRYSKAFYVDPVNGVDGNSGRSLNDPLASLYAAHDLMTAGNNDVCYLVGSGSTAATARLSVANAVTAAARNPTNPVPTTGTLTWSKAACHIIGIAAPTSISMRARIAPPTGVYTQATFGSGNFVVVSAQGCYFSNIDVFNGFSTGGTNQICWTDSGGRNCYNNMNFQGMADAASAADTGSRSLLVTGTVGENTFYGGTIGLDTIARSSGTSEMQLAGGSPRNRFINCVIETNAGAAGCFWMTIGSGGIDRYVLFDNCTFINPTLGGPAATAMTVGFSLNGTQGGAVIMKNCVGLGATKFTATANLAVTNLPAAAAGGGLGVVIS